MQNRHKLLKLTFDEDYVYSKELEQSLDSREKFGDNIGDFRSGSEMSVRNSAMIVRI